MNFNTFKTKFLEFFLVDVFNSYLYVRKLLLTVAYQFRFNYFQVFIQKVIVKDSNGLTDVTNNFMNNRSLSSTDDYLVYISWKYNFKDFFMVYHSSKPVPFIPFSINYLNKRHRTKYISVIVDDIVQSDEFFNFFIKFAGPDFSFYNSKPHLDWILPNSSKVELLKTDGTFINYIDIP